MTEHENQRHESSSAPIDVIESVQELINMMNTGGIGELDLTAGDVSIRLRTESVALAAATPVIAMSAAPMGYPAGAMVATASVDDTTSAATSPAVPEIEGHIVTSPMIGTFYSATAPGEPAFAQVGDDVETGQTIGIIEAMKIMNEITADRSGVIVEVMVENSEAVEYGSPLVRISDTTRFD